MDKYAFIAKLKQGRKVIAGQLLIKHTTTILSFWCAILTIMFGSFLLNYKYMDKFYTTAIICKTGTIK
jgi:hypothetical protein